MANRILRAAAMGITWLALGFALGAQAAPSSAQAMELFKQHKWAEASAAFQQIEDAAPGRTDALLFAAKCLVNLGKFSEAGAALQEYRFKHAQSEDAAYLLGYVLFREGKAADSLQTFTAAAQLKPPTADDLKIVALDYVLLSDFDDAGRYLEQALQRDPENAEILYHLGRVRYQQNRFDDAIAAFEHSLRVGPTDAKTENNLGLSLEAENQTDAAVTAYRKAIKLDQAAEVHSEQPYLNLGVLLTKSNRAAEALELLQQAARMAPSSNRARYELGKAYFELGEFAKAEPELEAAIHIEPKSRESHYLLGRIYQRLGKAERAAQEFKITESLVRVRDPGESGMAAAPGPGAP